MAKLVVVVVVFLAVGMLTELRQPLVVRAEVQLDVLSTVYLPAAKDRMPAFGEGAVEQIAYDPDRKFIYASGYNVYHVINAADPRALKVELTRYETGREFTDVDVCGDHVFMLAHNENDQLKGVLRVYKAYDKNRADPFELVKELEVGSLPDSLAILKDCKTVLVAVEGEAFTDNGQLVDPEGEIKLVHFPRGVEKSKDKATITPMGFSDFNNRYQNLEPSGLRFVYRANNNKLSNDLEPEFLSVDEDGDKAYVVLQESNAIAELDLVKQRVTSVRGLGYKRWGSLDASDKDGGIFITYWPIRAWYNPDAVKFYQWQGRKLLFTANEGDNKEYSTPEFDEAIRGADISKSDLGSGIHDMIRSAVEEESKLGRLKFSRIDGKDQAGKYQALYTYGARSFSIWDVTSGTGEQSSPLPQVFDSGSQLEEMTALYCPHLFNRAEDDVDDRSDDKGVEPESVTVGEINGRLYVFIGMERPGSIAVFSIGRDVTRPRFETMFCKGIPDSLKSMQEMFQDREIFGADPEDLRFYPADKSPTGRPVLMMPGSVTGTVTLLDIKVNNNPGDFYEGYIPVCPGRSAVTGASFVLTFICLLLHFWW